MREKKFVRFIDIETGQYCDDIFGRCDREVECNYFKSPGGSNNITVFVPKPVKLPFYISESDFKNTLLHYHENNLHTFLIKLYDVQKTKDVFSLYHVGTSKKWEGATLFWQINQYQIVGQGKIMLFNPENGKRIKKPFPHISSVHTQLKKQDQLPEYCFFGEHLISHFPQKTDSDC